MLQESPRIAELRRRVHADPASIAFAQLAEEYRRAGNFSDAVKYCRTGLARHPGYLSARVTLGRALMELGELDDATREFEMVLRSAPDNLAAVRAMAEIYQRRGNMSSALEYYKRALTLARFDPELEESVARITREMGQVAAAMPGGSSSTGSGEGTGQTLMDFDSLLAALGAPNAGAPPVVERLLDGSNDVPVNAASLPPVDPAATGHDPFADLEQQLRSGERPASAARTAAVTRAVPSETAGPSPSRAGEMIVQELESWLSVLVAERGAISEA